MFDTHTHTNRSADSKQTIDELCQAAIARGVQAIALTNHADVFAGTKERNASIICGSADDVESAKTTYGASVKLFKGIEMGMYHYDITLARKLCSLADLDIVLGSVHSFPFGDKAICFSKDDLSDSAVSLPDLMLYVGRYYEELQKTAKTADIDALCHLTYPFRYTNGRYHRALPLSLYADQFTQILKVIIERQIALEVNTARVGSDYDYPSPTYEIIQEYFDLGGRLITLGSDAHSPGNIANGFTAVKNMLRSIGFKEYVYFEKRKPKSIPL